mmetsp:Transcript_78157/g.253645  ORF Transcript_78157/g.253645 Transcript_78157/m.253645 type:complete len:231 (-) Transcript_78157:80-772(-)
MSLRSSKSACRECFADPRYRLIRQYATPQNDALYATSVLRGCGTEKARGQVGRESLQAQNLQWRAKTSQHDGEAVGRTDIEAVDAGINGEVPQSRQMQQSTEFPESARKHHLLQGNELGLVLFEQQRGSLAWQRQGSNRAQRDFREEALQSLRTQRCGVEVRHEQGTAVAEPGIRSSRDATRRTCAGHMQHVDGREEGDNLQLDRQQQSRAASLARLADGLQLRHDRRQR